MTPLITKLDGYDEYLISSDGRLFSKTRRGYHGRWLKPTTERNSRYAKVTLHGKSVDVHRLVAKTFIPNPFHKPEVNHIDGNRFNNDVTNLEWMTSAENKQHAVNMGLKINPRGEASFNSKLTDKHVAEVRRLYATGDYSQRRVGEIMGVSQALVGLIVLGKHR